MPLWASQGYDLAGSDCRQTQSYEVVKAFSGDADEHCCLTSLTPDPNFLWPPPWASGQWGSCSFGSTEADVLGLPGADPETSVCVRYRLRQ